jgi:hypothetical protein
MKDAVSYARIQANNAYYREVLGQKINKKLDSIIYLTGFNNLLDWGAIQSGKDF